MAEIVGEKVFKHFLEFPAEVRMIIIDEMSPEDRSRFTRCSKLSQKEARKCKSQIYGLKIYARAEDCIVIHVFYTEQFKNSNFGDYTVAFCENRHGIKYMSCTIPFGVELRRIPLQYSTNLVQIAAEQFKNMLGMYQNAIKMLSMRGTWTNDFGIKSLSKLEKLELGYQADIREFMSKIPKPLKEFECYTPITSRVLGDFEQIYQVQDLLKVREIHINYEQMLQFSAQKLYMNIGQITEENITDFIQSWQNDKFPNKFQYRLWNISNLSDGVSRTMFSIRKLLRLLDINVNDRPWTTYEIWHCTDVGKKAELGFFGSEVEFRVFDP